MKKTWVLMAVLSLLSGPLYGADLSLNGFLQANYSYSVTRSNPDGGDLKWAEERLQLRLDLSGEALRLFSKTDLYYDHIQEEADPEFRELYLDYTAEVFDLRAGRQVITWGLGDLLFINDVFPKDYEAFFSGRPLEYLKKGVDGLKVGIYPGPVSMEVVVIPFFEPSNFPDARRFWLYDPMPMVAEREEEEPSSSIDNTELAVRVYGDLAGFDTSLYLYRGFFRQPSMMPRSPSGVTLFYPELSVYGVSLQGRAFDGILSLEAGYYDSRQDRDGSDPVVPNSQTRFLVGYQRQLREDLTAAVQYYAEYMHRYGAYEGHLPAGLPKDRRLSQLVSLRLTQLLMHQTLRLSFFSFWSPSEGDYLINPEVRYSFTDSVWAAAGAVIFGGGEAWSRFGQLDEDDNLYIQLRYEF